MALFTKTTTPTYQPKVRLTTQICISVYYNAGLFEGRNKPKNHKRTKYRSLELRFGETNVNVVYYNSWFL